VGTIEHEGYVARVEFDSERACLVGRVVNARAPIEFTADAASQVAAALREAVDSYVADCARSGEDPERPFSGRLLLRIEPELHAAIAAAAARSDSSINGWIERTLRAVLDA
jgi:predicted HicB family RNase H-like nuclease